MEPVTQLYWGEGPNPGWDIRMDTRLAAVTQLYWWVGVRLLSDGLATASLTSDVTGAGNAKYSILYWKCKACIAMYCIALAMAMYCNVL